MPKHKIAQHSPGKLVRGLVTLLGKGTVFNDKIQGGRSIKVWGWDERLYNEAAHVLSRHGYRVRKVRTVCNAQRLHVFERQ